MLMANCCSVECELVTGPNFQAYLSVCSFVPDDRPDGDNFAQQRSHLQTRMHTATRCTLHFLSHCSEPLSLLVLMSGTNEKKTVLVYQAYQQLDH